MGVHYIKIFYLHAVAMPLGKQVIRNNFRRPFEYFTKTTFDYLGLVNSINLLAETSFGKFISLGFIIFTLF